MAPSKEQEGCSQESCRKAGAGKCRYCGETFCREHLKAKPSSVVSFLHDLPEARKKELEAEWKDRGGHPCAPYSRSWAEGRPAEPAAPSRQAARNPVSSTRHRIKKPPKQHRSHKKPVLITLLAAIIILAAYYQDDILYQTIPMTCPDGTLNRACSVNRPFYCLDGTLAEKSSICGCPEGAVQTGEGCGVKVSCIDGTSINQCSAAKPLFCIGGQLVSRASLCGCPLYASPAWASALPRWSLSSTTSFSNPKWHTNNISFTISPGCSQAQRERMLSAFSYLVISSNTSLSFTEVSDGCPDITVRCANESESQSLESGMGKAVLTQKDEAYYSVIYKAELTFSQGSLSCQVPVVQAHELLHAFGFGHSSDPEDIMHEQFSCQQFLKPGIRSDLAQIYPRG